MDRRTALAKARTIIETNIEISGAVVDRQVSEALASSIQDIQGLIDMIYDQMEVRNTRTAT